MQIFSRHSQMTGFPDFHPIWKAADNAALYTLILFSLLLFFAGVNWGIHHFGLRYPLSTRTMRVMSAAYGFVYAILEGLLIYYGIENYNILLGHLTENRGVINLISVSIVAMFCLLYAAFFHNSVSFIADKELKINLFSNVVSYGLTRFLLVSGIIVFTAYAVNHPRH